MPSLSDLIAMGALDDELGADDFVGASRRGLMRRAAPRLRTAPRGNALQSMRQTIMPAGGMPGVPPIGGRMEPLGLGSFSFTNASAQTAQLTGRPQKPFKGARLVFTVTRSGAAAIQVNLTSLFIGQNNQLVSSQALSVEIFGPTAVGIELNLDPAVPGIDVVASLATTATPAAGDSITVVGAIIGVTFG